jgi:hypothetical protein
MGLKSSNLEAMKLAISSDDLLAENTPLAKNLVKSNFKQHLSFGRALDFIQAVIR